MELITQAKLGKIVGVSAAYIAKLKKRGVFEGCFYGNKLKRECALEAINSFRKIDSIDGDESKNRRDKRAKKENEEVGGREEKRSKDKKSNKESEKDVIGGDKDKRGERKVSFGKKRGVESKDNSANSDNEGSGEDIDRLKSEIRDNMPENFREIDGISRDIEALALLLVKIKNPAAKVSITKEFWAGKMNEVKYLKEKGKYLDKEEVESVFAEIGSAIRDKLLTLPGRVSAVLAGKSDRVEITNILDSEIKEVLESLVLEIGKN